MYTLLVSRCVFSQNYTAVKNHSPLQIIIGLEYSYSLNVKIGGKGKLHLNEALYLINRSQNISPHCLDPV